VGQDKLYCTNVDATVVKLFQARGRILYSNTTMAAVNRIAQRSKQALLYKCRCYCGKTPILFLIHNYFSLFIPGKGKNISCKHNNGGCEHNCTEVQDGLYCSCYPGFQANKQDLTTCEGVLV